MTAHPKLAPEQQLTIEEFLAFTDTRPDEERWELIEGVAVLNPSPVEHHQIGSREHCHVPDDAQAANRCELAGDAGRGHPRSDLAAQPAAAGRLREGSGATTDLPVTEDALVLFEVLSRSNTKADQCLAAQGLCQCAELPALRRPCRSRPWRSTRTIVTARWKKRTVTSLADVARSARARPLYPRGGHLPLDAARSASGRVMPRATCSARSCGAIPRTAMMDLDKLKTACRPRRQGQARARARRPQRAGEGRQGHRCDAARAARPGPAGPGQARRQGHRHLALRPAQGRARPAVQPEAGRGQARRSCSASRSRSLRDCIGEAGREDGGGAAARRGRRAGEPALPQGRGEERSRVRQALASSATSSSTTPSPPRIARTPPPMPSRACCRPTPAR